MKLGARIWRAIRYDIGRKATAFVLALGVWFILEGLVLEVQTPLLDVRRVNSVEDADRERVTAARSTLYLVIPQTLICSRIDPQTLRLRLQGLREDVRNLTLFATVEFSEADLGTQDEVTATRTLGREIFKGRDRTPELTLFRINGEATATIFATLSRRTTIRINLGPANVTTVGQPAKGYVMDSEKIGVKQYSVELSGPRQAVEKYRTDPSALKLEPVSIEGALRTVNQTVGLPPELAAQIQLDPPRIEVSVPIVAEDVEVDLVAIAVKLENLDALAKKGFRLASTVPDKRDIRVRGPAAELLALTTEKLAERILLVLDFEKAVLVPGNNRVPVSIFRQDLSEAVHVFALGGPGDEPPKVEFKLEEL